MVSRKRVREEAETSSASSVPADPRALLVLQDVAKLDKQGRFRYPSLHAKSLQAYVAFAKRLPTCTVVMEHQLRRFLSPAPPTGVSVAVAEDAAPLQQVPLLHSEKEIFQFLRVELDALVDEQLQLHGPDHADSKLALSMRQELVRAAQTHHMKML